MIVLSSSDVEPDNTSWRKKKRTSAEPEHKSGSASSKDMKSEIIDVKKTEKVKVKSEEPVKKRTTRSSSKKIKAEESDIEELPPVVKSHEEVVVDDDEVVTCSITGISLKELMDVRREVMQEMVQLPEHLRTRYYFEHSLEVKIQIYFGINDPEKLKRVRKVILSRWVMNSVANYTRKPVTKHDVSKPKKTDAEPTVPEAGKSEEETGTETHSSNSNGSDGEETTPEFEPGSDGDRSESDAPVVQPQPVGRGRHDVAEPKPAVPNETAQEVVGGSRRDITSNDDISKDISQPQVVGGSTRYVSENLESDSAVKKEETEEKLDGAAPKPKSDSAIKKEETEEKADGAAPKPESDSAVKNEETVEKTKSAIKPDVCDVHEKLCQTEA